MFQLRCLVLKELVFTFARQQLGPIPPGIASVASSGWPGLPDWQLYTGSPGHWGHCQDRPDKSISKQSPVSSSSSEQPSVWGDNHPSFPQTHSCSVLLTGIMLLAAISGVVTRLSHSVEASGCRGWTEPDQGPRTAWHWLEPDQRVRPEAATGDQGEEWLHTRHHLTLMDITPCTLAMTIHRVSVETWLVIRYQELSMKDN